MWIVYAFSSAFFAGITAVLSKIGVKDIDSNAATAVRTAVVLILSWIIVFAGGAWKDIANISQKTLTFLILSGLSTGASWLCYFKALQRGDVNKVASVDKSSVILSMLFAFIFLREEVTFLKIICIIFIGAGTYIMIDRKKTDTKPQTGWLAWAVLSAVFAALTSILGKVGIDGINSNLGTAIRTIIVLIMACIMMFVTKSQKTLKNAGGKSMLFLIISGFATCLSWLAYYRALQQGIASVVVPIDKLSIVFTVVFSYLIIKERVTKKTVFGLLLSVAGTLLLLV